MNQVVKDNLKRFQQVTGRLNLSFGNEKKLLKQIQKEFIDQETIDKCLYNFDQNVNCQSPFNHGITVYSCACCGISEFAPKTEITGKEKYDASENRWKFCENFKFVAPLKVPEIKKETCHPFANILKAGIDWFYLIPDLVTLEDGSYTFKICPSCSNSLNNKKVPKLCVASGFDLHQIPPYLKENKLSWMEEILISLAVPLVYTVKLKGDSNSGEAITSHVICVPHDGVQIATKLPLTNVSNIIQIRVFGNTAANAKQSLRILPQFQVRPDLLFEWLQFLKETNDLYKDVEIEVPDNYIENLMEQLESNLKIVQNKDATDVEENCVDSYTEVSDDCFGGSLIPSNEQRTNKDLISQLAVNINQPFFNDYTDTTDMLYKAFPSKIPFGCELSNGPPPVDLRRKLLLYYDNRFSTDKNFIFLLFNQTMRSCANRSASLYIKNNMESIEAINKFLSEPNVLSKMEFAMKNPYSPEFNEIIQKISKHLHVPGASVPFSNHQRNLSLAEMISYYRHFGPPTFFITVTPSNIDNPMIVKLAGHKLKRNISLNRRKKLMADNPIACVESFFKSMNSMFSHLIGIKNSSKLRKTYIIKEKFLFGTPTAFYGVIEAQQRGALHIHFLLWTKISPELLRFASSRKTVLDELIKVLDSMIQAFLPDSTLQNYFEFKQNPTNENFRVGNEQTPTTDDFDIVYDWVAHLNTHRHTQTCHKGNSGKYSCRVYN